MEPTYSAIHSMLAVLRLSAIRTGVKYKPPYTMTGYEVPYFGPVVNNYRSKNNSRTASNSKDCFISSVDNMLTLTHGPQGRTLVIFHSSHTVETELL